jgi:hypothetical protein
LNIFTEDRKGREKIRRLPRIALMAADELLYIRIIRAIRGKKLASISG